jgi:hypothetical protein
MKSRNTVRSGTFGVAVATTAVAVAVSSSSADDDPPHAEAQIASRTPRTKNAGERIERRSGAASLSSPGKRVVSG